MRACVCYPKGQVVASFDRVMTGRATRNRPISSEVNLRGFLKCVYQPITQCEIT